MEVGSLVGIMERRGGVDRGTGVGIVEKKYHWVVSYE